MMRCVSWWEITYIRTHSRVGLAMHGIAVQACSSKQQAGSSRGLMKESNKERRRRGKHKPPHKNTHTI